MLPDIHFYVAKNTAEFWGQSGVHEVHKMECFLIVEQDLWMCEKDSMIRAVAHSRHRFLPWLSKLSDTMLKAKGRVKAHQDPLNHWCHHHFYQPPLPPVPSGAATPPTPGSASAGQQLNLHHWRIQVWLQTIWLLLHFMLLSISWLSCLHRL